MMKGFASVSFVYLDSSLLGCATWIFLHCYPVRGDHAVLVLAVFSSLFALSVRLFSHIDSPLLFSFQIITTYLASLASTTLAYRLSPFHPLSRYPGPLLWAASSVFLARAAATGRRYLIIDELHRKHGEFVRLGPDVLSVSSPDAPRAIYSSAYGLDKGDYYQRPGHPSGVALFFKTKRIDHFKRKRIWKRSFTSIAALEFLPSLERRTWELVSCILRRKDDQGLVNLLQCFSHYSYDFMGEFVYGGANDLELMRDGDVYDLVGGAKSGLAMFDSLGHMPWLMDIVWHIPAGKDVFKLFEIAAVMIQKRSEFKTIVFRDLVSYLLEGDPVSGELIPMNELNDDAAIATQSASDTTSSTLATVFSFLLTHPKVLETLHGELKKRFDTPDGPLDTRVLADVPYLDAVINEAFRLTPPLFSPRVVSKTGVAIDNHYIPGGTIAVISAYTQQTSPDNFWPDPLSYRPERWLPGGLGPDSKLKKDVFLPFSAGTFVCVAKDWAILQARFVVARLVLVLDLRVPASFDADKFHASYRNHRSVHFQEPLLVHAESRCDAIPV